MTTIVKASLTDRAAAAAKRVDLAKQKLGLALLTGEGDTLRLRDDLSELEREHRDVELMLGAFEAYAVRERSKAQAEATRAKATKKAMAERDAELKDLGKPSTAKRGDMTAYEEEKRRFERDYEKLKGSEELVNRSEELYELARSCGGAAKTDCRRWLGRFGGSPEIQINHG